jgi:hypothetical protein
MIADCLTVPTRDTRKSMRNVFNLDVERRRIEQIESSPAQHSLPSACAGLGDNIMHSSREPYRQISMSIYCRSS